ncbi:MAG: aldo/keto reductase [Armatimonadota bacterium]|nr:MAG: aldo/keto reductase [Armatimonadota bacterium]
MQYREYGKTGKKVSALGYGAMRLPFEEPEESVALLRLGMDLGINYIDTAFGYGGEGRSEKYIGEAIKGRRDQVYIATKNPLQDETPEGWWQRLETSLERLQTDYIDIYKVVHGLRWEVYTRVYEPTLHELALKARDQGMIRHLAFSCHDAPENMIKLIDTGVFDGMLLQYNLLDRRNEEAIAHAHEKGMAVEIMGPVGGGRLGLASERMQSVLPGASSTPEIALRFVLANPNVTIAFSGMGTREQVEENCAVASREGPLSEQELQAIEQALEENKRLSDLYCTGCEYCLPCAEGVAIPDIFAAMNYHRVWGLTEYGKHLYGRLGPDNKHGKLNATACVECGECEEKCPQDIEIIRQLKESHEALS